MKKKLELLKTSDNEKTLKAYRGKKKIHITDRSTKTRKRANFLLGTRQDRRQWSNIFLVLQETKLSVEHFVSSKDIFEIRG